MIIANPNTLTSPEQLLAMPDGNSFELVSGRLVERPMGFRSSRVGAALIEILRRFCTERNLGWVTNADAGFQCFPDEPLKVRKPDAAYISFARLPQDQEPEGNCKVAPDIAIEVISPNDVFEDVTRKVEEYLVAGVPIVWVVDPQTKRVLVYYPNGGRILTERDELSGENVLPGFSCQVRAIFSA